MFNSSKKSAGPNQSSAAATQLAASKAQKKANSRDASAVTILTSGCQFSGKLYCRGSSRIGGKIEGQLISEGLLIIEDGAHVAAEIKAEEAIIQGYVQGKLHATGRVELAATSRFNGDIATPTLIVREGAQFNGQSTMLKPNEAGDVTSGKTPRIVAMHGKGDTAADHNGKTPDVHLTVR